MRSVLAQVGGAIALVALAAGLVLGLIVGWWLGLTVGLAIAAVTASYVGNRVRNAEERALRHIGPARAPTSETVEARFVNLVEGLAPNAGVPRPQPLVLDDPALNALAIGRDQQHGCVIATRALLDSLSRIELEAVVAHGLARIRDGVTAAPTLAIALTGPGGLVQRSVTRHVSAAQSDLAAVGLTRYPPGLLAAMKASTAPPGTATPALQGLWFVTPDGNETGRRMAALAEL